MSETALTLEQVQALFTAPDGSYRFARWGRPIAPVAFGIDDDSLGILKDSIARTVGITGGTLAETDPELGVNFIWMFCREWTEIAEVPQLEGLIPNLTAILTKLTTQRANQYRRFTFDDTGAIQMCILLLRMDEALSTLPIQSLSTIETLKSLLIWSPDAFALQNPVGQLGKNGLSIVKPQFTAVVRAAYSPLLPGSSSDPAHALRLQARAGQMIGAMAG